VSLYEQSGGDPTRCEFCNRKLTNKKPWRRGLDGAGAHEACIADDYERDAEADVVDWHDGPPVAEER
jgi:hypothetical protein